MIVREARNAWEESLEQISAARADLHCSVSTAWFRGHEDSRWRLLPTRLRDHLVSFNTFDGESDAKISEWSIEKKCFYLLKKDYWLSLNLSEDQKKELSTLAGSVLASKKVLKDLEDDVRTLKFVEGQIRDAKSARFEETNYRFKLDEFLYKHNIPHVKHTSLLQTLKTIDENAVAQAYGPLSVEVTRLRRELSESMRQMEQGLAITYGEEDVFVEFNFRSRHTHGTSWQALAMMQHYGVHTRLLDWTESLGIAFSFALRKYMDRYEGEVRSCRGSMPDLDSFIESCEHRWGDLAEPTVIVLNPYFLVRRCTTENKISDVTLDSRLDYYDRFFVRKDWPYKYPFPIYSPWRDDRIASQHAMFTIHGTDLRALDEQDHANDFLRKITISRAAAAFGARHLVNLFPLDRFSLFRDLDSLGKTLQSKYMRPKPAFEENKQQLYSDLLK